MFIVLVGEVLARGSAEGMPSYEENYKVTWAPDHVLPLHQGRDLQLSLDQDSGSGIASKLFYESGFFHLKIKLPGRNSAGVVTAFYVAAHKFGNELDFEFLGNKEGKPYIVQTNVFADGIGNREQRIHLWFDPTATFHNYKILWNPHQIVFSVDDIPIRVYKNKTNIGVGYPARPMHIVASIWNGDNWATDGGQTKINWTYAPFRAEFRNFAVYGCPARISNIGGCYSPKLWWNGERYWSLSPTENKDYQTVKNNYMIYDYCTDRHRYPVPPPECPQ